jgi:hypothetical protein
VNKGAIPLRDDIEEMVNELICNHAPLRHSSEVTSALWACLALNLSLHDDAVDAVSRCDDSCVALLALDCRNKGRLSKALDTSLWESQMGTAGLYDDHWLLAYEANVKGWLPNPGAVDYVNADANFGYLKANGVYFYEESLASSAPQEQIPMPRLPSINTLSSSLSV